MGVHFRRNYAASTENNPQAVDDPFLQTPTTTESPSNSAQKKEKIDKPVPPEEVINPFKDSSILEKPEIQILPSFIRLKQYHWFAKTLGWIFFIGSFYLSFGAASFISENSGCLLSVGTYFATVFLLIFLFRFIGLKLKLFSLIYFVLLYESLANWIYGLL